MRTNYRTITTTYEMYCEIASKHTTQTKSFHRVSPFMNKNHNDEC